MWREQAIYNFFLLQKEWCKAKSSVSQRKYQNIHYYFYAYALKQQLLQLQTWAVKVVVRNILHGIIQILVQLYCLLFTLFVHYINALASFNTHAQHFLLSFSFSFFYIFYTFLHWTVKLFTKGNHLYNVFIMHLFLLLHISCSTCFYFLFHGDCYANTKANYFHFKT